MPAKLPKKIRKLVTDMGKVVAYFCNSSDVCIGLGKAIAELRSLALSLRRTSRPLKPRSIQARVLLHLTFVVVKYARKYFPSQVK